MVNMNLLKKIGAICLALALVTLVNAVDARAASTVTGGTLLNLTDANQLANWLGNGNQAFNNIYGGIDPLAFTSAAAGQGATFTLAEVFVNYQPSQYFGQTFLVGGYNPTSWTSSFDYTYTPLLADRTAFLFNLTNPNMKGQNMDLGPPFGTTGEFQTFNHPFHPEFGAGADLYMISSDGTNNFTAGFANAYSYGNGMNVFGESYTEFDTRRVELFTSSTIVATPEPAAGDSQLNESRQTESS